MQQLLPSFDASPDLAAVYTSGRGRPDGRPWVAANMVAGLDGSAAVHGRVGGLSGPSDKAVFELLRSLADIVLVGASTVRAERYGRVKVAPHPPVAVVTRSVSIDWTIPLFADPGPSRPIVVTTERAGHDAIAAAEKVADVVVAGETTVDLGVALRELAQRWGATTVLTEGGPSLLGELVTAGLLDELCLTIAPVAGGDPLPTVSFAAPLPELARFRLANVLEDGGHVFLRHLAEA